MTVLIVIAIGFLTGLIARVLVPGTQPGGFVFTTLLGIGGALTAGILGQFFGYYRMDEAAGFYGALIGSLLILLVFRILAARPDTGVKKNY